MKNTSLFLLIILLLCSCDLTIVAPDTPDCIIEKISNIRSEYPDSKAYAWELTFNSKYVYYISPRFEDDLGSVYDQYCNLLCHPDGGISGNGDGSCPDFFDQAKFVRTIWEAN